MARQKTHPGKREQAAERRVQALKLRQGGLGYAAIAQALGVSLAQAHNDVTRSLADLKAIEQKEAEDLRQLMCLRFDRWLDRLDAKIEKGDAKAIQTAIKIEERRARLLGLD